MAKLKNSNCDKTKKRRKKIVTKFKRSNCNQTQKLESCKTKKKILTTQKLKYSNINDSSDKSSYNDIFE